MKFRLRALNFKYTGGMAQAIACGNCYSMVMIVDGKRLPDDEMQFTAHVTGYALEASGDKFQAHVVAVNLGTGTIERCAFFCQQHFVSAVAEFIAPVKMVSGK